MRARRSACGRLSFEPKQASTGPRTCARGDYERRRSLGRRRQASTGPRTCARGDQTASPTPAPQRESFNGAAHLRARRSWIALRPKDDVRQLQRGRALARAEIADPHAPGRSSKPLQRGRALARAEMVGEVRAYSPEKLASTGPRTCARGDHRRRRIDHAYVVASTGPRTCARGDLSDQPAGNDDVSCFNGAAHLRARRSCRSR